MSIETELKGIAALATRWRRLELASWRGTLARVAVAHAAGARHSWFHLYQVLVVGFGSAEGQGEGQAGGELQQAQQQEEGEEVPWWRLAKEWRGTGTGTTSSLGVGAEDSTAQQAQQAGLPDEAAAVTAAEAEEEKWYRRSAAALEAFLQMSTVGEFEARLQLLASFHAHLQVRQHILLAACQAPAAHSLHQQQPEHQQQQQQRQRQLQRSHILSSALANTRAYYAQFVPSVRAAIAASMAPHEKELAEFVTLAKWEDRGYYALRASAEKAQRHLHKCVCVLCVCVPALGVVQALLMCVLACAAQCVMCESDSIFALHTYAQQQHKHTTLTHNNTHTSQATPPWRRGPAPTCCSCPCLSR